MTIMNDGEEIESIELKEYDESEEALHALFKEKGFEQVSGEELREALEERSKALAEKQRVETERKLENKKRMELENKKRKKDLDLEAMDDMEEAKEALNKAFAEMKIEGNKKRSSSDPAAIEQLTESFFAELEKAEEKKRGENVKKDQAAIEQLRKEMKESFDKTPDEL